MLCYVVGSLFHEVDICDPLDLSVLVSDESIKKFQMAISPTKTESPPLMTANAQSMKISNFIEDADHSQRSAAMATRLIKSLLMMKYC